MNWYDEAFPKDADRPGCWLRWLAETDEDIALLHRDAQQRKAYAKRLRGTWIGGLEGAMEQRKAVAETKEDVVQADIEFFQANQAWEALHEQRETIKEHIKCWQTLQANQRATTKGM